MSDSELIQFLRDHAEFFETSSFFGDAMRQFGWIIIKFLKKLCDGAQSVFDTAFQLFDFTESELFMNFWNQYKTIMIPLLILSIAGIGFRYMLNVEKKPTQFLKNFFILIGVSSCMLTIIPFMNESILAMKRGVLGDVSVTQANEIINNGFYDLTYIDRKNGFSDFNIHYNAMTTNRIENIDITAKVTPDDEGISSKAAQIYEKQIVDTGDADGSYELEKMKSSILGLKDPPYYYRYKIEYFNTIITLLALILVFIFYAFKIVILVWEVIATEILAVLFAPNIGNSEKMNKILNTFLNVFTTFAVIIIMIKMYALSLTFIGQQSWGGLSKAIIMLAVSFAVILGPNVIQRITGYDMGIGNEMSQIYFASRVAGAMFSPLEKAGRTLSQKAAEATKDGAGKVGDMIKGFQEEYATWDKESEGFYNGNNEETKKEGFSAKDDPLNPLDENSNMATDTDTDTVPDVGEKMEDGNDSAEGMFTNDAEQWSSDSGDDFEQWSSDNGDDSEQWFSGDGSISEGYSEGESVQGNPGDGTSRSGEGDLGAISGVGKETEGWNDSTERTFTNGTEQWSSEQGSDSKQWSSERESASVGYGEKESVQGNLEDGTFRSGEGDLGAISGVGKETEGWNDSTERTFANGTEQWPSEQGSDSKQWSSERESASVGYGEKESVQGNLEDGTFRSGEGDLGAISGVGKEKEGWNDSTERTFANGTEQWSLGEESASGRYPEGERIRENPENGTFRGGEEHTRAISSGGKGLENEENAKQWSSRSEYHSEPITKENVENGSKWEIPPISSASSREQIVPSSSGDMHFERKEKSWPETGTFERSRMKDRGEKNYESQEAAFENRERRTRKRKERGDEF